MQICQLSKGEVVSGVHKGHLIRKRVLLSGEKPLKCQIFSDQPQTYRDLRFENFTHENNNCSVIVLPILWNLTFLSPYTKTTGFPGGFLICISTWVELSAQCVTSTTFEDKSTVQYWTAGRGWTLKSSHVLASRWLHCTSPQDYVTFTLFEGLRTFSVNSSDTKLSNTWHKQSWWSFTVVFQSTCGKLTNTNTMTGVKENASPVSWPLYLCNQGKEFPACTCLSEPSVRR